MKKIILLICLICIFGLLPACGGPDNSGPPGLKVTSGGIAISSVVGLNRWDGSLYDREDNFKVIMKDIAVSDLPYIHLGKSINIAFSGKAPDSATLTDHILRPDGRQKFTDATVETIDITFRSGKGAFTLEKNWATAFSSDSSDYLPGASIRGFRLVCRWGGNEYEYAFIIRSDAAILFSVEEEPAG